MLTAICLIPGLLLAQPPLPAKPQAEPVRAVRLLQPFGMDDLPADPVASENSPNSPSSIAGPVAAETPVQSSTAPSVEPPPPFSIYSRSPFADRNGLSFIGGAGPGRFNIIDWESRPNGDRYWWLGRWPIPEDVQLYAGIGFNIHWWAGPVGDGAAPAPNLPPQVFDLYLDLSWSQRWSDRLTTEIRARPGLYTDFRTTPPDAFRIPGEAIGVFQATPELYLVAGVQYLQRNDIQLLPVAGLLWQPAPRWELSLIFPEPKIAYELSTKQHLWGYVAGEYGGGRWTYKNDAGHSERVEYSNFRLVVGLEWREDYLAKLPLLSSPSTSELADARRGGIRKKLETPGFPATSDEVGTLCQTTRKRSFE